MPEQPAAPPTDRPQTDPPAPAEKTRGWSATLRALLTGRIVRWSFVALAVILGVLAVGHQWASVRSALVHLGLLPVAGAMLAVLLGMAAAMQSWRVLLAALGSPLSATAASRVVFVGQLGKYVPGSIWSVVGQMEVARSYQVPRRRSATASLLAMLFSLAAALLAAVLTLPFLAGPQTAKYRLAFLLVPVLLACLYPRVLNPVLQRLLRIARRPPLEQPLSLRAVGLALFWALVSWLCYGLHIWLLAVRLGGPPGRTAVLAVGGFAFAWSIGFIAIFAPAGVGVRDTILVGVLGTVLLRNGEPTAIAVVSRLLTSVGDLVAAGLAAASSGRVRARSERMPTGEPRVGDPEPR